MQIPVGDFGIFKGFNKLFPEFSPAGTHEESSQSWDKEIKEKGRGCQ
jgi:hypothetical protein